MQFISIYNTNTFKNRLDRFWQNQEIIYDFHARNKENTIENTILVRNFGEVYIYVYMNVA